ncbi:VWA domain-containing protein [Streptomyces sp. YC504]|uniref:VWA domain-containing protein n=1 Tax=Streptomyces mesophilus TaxID=1775132 RepID=A0A6G4XDZ3_9ACTN|nr:VWA domain-containing protein [Streptomyces mesophilus]NGO75755.1 VWA domain-containing protein [Streptomyces mesophilus]
MSTPWRIVAAALGAALALAVTPSAHADEPEGSSTPRIETIIDASGSMKERSGTTVKMDAAKAAVTQLIDRIPAEAPMGLRVYGATYPGEDKTTGCADTQLLTPVEPMNQAAKQDAKQKINALVGTGFTPIGDTLRIAAEELGTEGNRRIILVSDGEDTCAPPDPCNVARELKDQGVDLVIDTLGFQVDAKAERQLRCIADATGGQYDPVGSDDLAEQLDDAFKRAWNPYEVSGSKTSGSDRCATAPLLAPGQYTDEVTHTQERWYKAKLTVGQAMRFSASMVPQSAYKTGAALRLDYYLPGKSHAWKHEVSVTQNWANLISAGTESDRLTYKDLPAGARDGEICVKVSGRIDSVNKTEPIELLVATAHQEVTADGAPAPDESSTADGDTKVVPQASSSASSPLVWPLIGTAALIGLLLSLLIRTRLNRGDRS